jgi:hypothetical protein
MALPNRMSLPRALLWLTVNLALIIRCLARINIYRFFFNFTYPLRCFRVPQVEYYCSRLLFGRCLTDTPAIPTEVFRALPQFPQTDAGIVSRNDRVLPNLLLY